MKVTFDVTLRIDCDLPEGKMIGDAQDAIDAWLSALIVERAQALQYAPMYIKAVGPLEVKSR